MRPSLWFYPAPPVSYLMTRLAQRGPAMPAPGGRKAWADHQALGRYDWEAAWGTDRQSQSLGRTLRRISKGAARARSCPPPWLSGTCSATLTHIIQSYLS